jgi:hypothetical protein
MKFILISVVLFFALGCGIAEGPRQKLDRGIFQFHEGLRWGRQSDVLPAVDEQAREHFQKMHAGWGTAIQISSADVIQVVYDDKARKAVVSVRFAWFRKKEMVAYETVTRQNWEYRGGKWWLVAEEFLSGQPF